MRMVEFNIGIGWLHEFKDYIKKAGPYFEYGGVQENNDKHHCILTPGWLSPEVYVRDRSFKFVDIYKLGDTVCFSGNKGTIVKIDPNDNAKDRIQIRFDDNNTMWFGINGEYSRISNISVLEKVI